MYVIWHTHARCPTKRIERHKFQRRRRYVASAGGISALIELLGDLDRPFALPVFIAQHLSRSAPSILPSILTWHSGCTAKWAEQDENPKPGVVYVLPPKTGMEVRNGNLNIRQLGDDARNWLEVPDQLLRSLSNCYGSTAVGVVLSGMLATGLQGLRAIRSRGGITMAQNEKSSGFFEMPQAAIDLGRAEIVLSPRRLAQALNVLAEQRVGEAILST